MKCHELSSWSCLGIGESVLTLSRQDTFSKTKARPRPSSKKPRQGQGFKKGASRLPRGKTSRPRTTSLLKRRTESDRKLSKSEIQSLSSRFAKNCELDNYINI